MPRSLSSSSFPSVLVIGEDAGEYVRLIDAAELSIPVTTCHNVAEARTVYAEQPILFGNPESIARVLPDMPTVEWVQSTWAGVTPLLEIDRRDYLLTGIKAGARGYIIKDTPFEDLARSIRDVVEGGAVISTRMAGKLLDEVVVGETGRFDLFARLPHRRFPGGRPLAGPALRLALLWYRLRDLL